ncbi:MAG: hypothetical protein NTY09_08410 [bacterium]|nr:hypothetical protein [bacterium]
MKIKEKRNVSRWGLLAAAAIFIVLLVGGAIYAQGGFRQGPGRGD